jgi:cytochrome b
MRRILIWDQPTRLCHWLLVISFCVAWLTSGSDRWLSLHSFFDYLMLGLIGFRLVWGLLGGHYARFSSFAYGPKAGFIYVRDLLARRATHYVGHNPAGSQAIYLLFGLGLIVCISGVLTQGGEEQQLLGHSIVTVPSGALIKGVHELAADLMLLVVIVHLGGVATESWLTKDNLPLSMLTGRKEAPSGATESEPHLWIGAGMVAVVTAFAVWWFLYALHEPIEKRLGHDDASAETPHVAFVGPKLPTDPTWREECGACHLAFHSNLLPERSWRELMAGQASHFGSDLALDPSTQQTVLLFLVQNAAEKSNTEAANKINRSIPPSMTPLRITDTPYWVDKHRDVAAAVWQLPGVKSKANCAARHSDAEAGTFEDAAMRIPH